MAKITIKEAFDRALQHQMSGRLAEAEKACRVILARQPENPDAMHLYGVLCHQSGRNDLAEQFIRGAIRLRPNWADAHNNLGSVLSAQTRLNDAIAAYRHAIALRPGYADAHNNLGNVLGEVGKMVEAVAEYRRAIALRPGYAGAHNNLGNAQSEMGNVDEALEEYRTAIRLDPDYADAHGNLLFTLHFQQGTNASTLAREHQLWHKKHAQPLSKFIQPHRNDPDPERRLRIGYVSPDFRDHVAGWNLLPLLSNHDRQHFEIFCYSQAPHPDRVTALIKGHVDAWRSIIGMADEKVAALIREDQIDLLVDLALHSANNRLLVFAYKPAPVQITYLGYCSTTGLETMDYRLSDPHFDPPGTDLSVYSEKTVRLPHTFWCYHPRPAPEPGAIPALANHFITFGCLNNFAKVSQKCLATWAAILSQVPGSKLMIHAPAGANVTTAVEQMTRANVTSERLIFVGQQRWDNYVATYQKIDIALDPFPFNGGITTCDALWMGVPVVTWSGGTTVGRAGRSILSNVGLPELVASTLDEYVQIAAAWASDLSRLGRTREELRGMMVSSPLMNGLQFARDVENAYRDTWRLRCKNWHYSA